MWGPYHGRKAQPRLPAVIGATDVAPIQQRQEFDHGPYLKATPDGAEHKAVVSSHQEYVTVTMRCMHL